MKRLNKIILITGILLSTSLWADMDKVCLVSNSPNGLDDIERHKQNIFENCERNNILNVLNVSSYAKDFFEAYYCRFDRNVNATINKLRSDENKTKWLLNCVLYDNKPRDVIVIK